MTEDQGGWPPTESETWEQPAPTGLPLLPPLPPPSVSSVAPRPETPAPPPLGAFGTNDFSVASTGRASNGRAKLVVLLAGLVVLVGAIAGSVVFGMNNGPSPVAIQSPTAANSELFAAALSSGSFHYSDVTSGTLGGHAVTATQSGDDGRTEGVQYMTSALGDYEVIVVNSMAYMKPNLTMLENTFGYSPSLAAPYVNRWIAFRPSDTPYDSVAADVTTETTWNNPSESPTDDLPQTPESVTGLSTLNGQSVQSVRYSLHGTSKAANASYSGTETMSFSATDPHLPTDLTEQLSGMANQQTSTESVQVTFTQWGEPVSVAAPTASIPYSTLPSSETVT